MFRFSLMTLLAALVGTLPARAQLAEYVNNGVATDEVVDAITFINNGEFNVTTLQVPWDSQNTRHFINRGLMRGSLGFRLEHVSPIIGQQRRPADTFFNARTGQISGLDGGGNGLIITEGTLVNGFLFTADQSFITVNALSVTNRGLISAGAGGVVRVHGGMVDLSGGALGVDPLGTFSEFTTIGFGPNLTSSNFFPDPGLYDQAWGIESITNMFLGNIINLTPDGFRITTPVFNLTNSLFSCGGRIISLTNAHSWVRQSVGSATNQNFEVVVVATGDTNIVADVRFLPFAFPDVIVPPTDMGTSVIELSSRATNLFTLEPYTNRIYIYDQLASSTNQNLLVNITEGTLRPAPFVVFRGDEFTRQLFDVGSTSNSVIDSDLFDSPLLYSNQVVTNIQAGYAMQIESLQTRVAALPDVGPTNFPGRVEIRATDLTMTAARIRGEGLVSIRATNFLDSSDSIVDVPRLALNLGSSGAPLRVQGLAREFVERLNGPLIMYSAVWTNTRPNVDTNLGPVEVRFHLTVVDARNLRGVQNTMTHELSLSTRNGATLEINDPITVSDQFRVDSDNLTVNGRLVLQPGRTWSPTNLTRLANFTNNGVLQMSELAQFEKIDGTGYDNFINAGRIQAYASLIRAEYFENRGGDIVSTQYATLNATNDFCLGTIAFQTNFGPSIGLVSINAAVAKFEGGSARTGGDIRLTGGVFKFNNFSAQAGGRLLIDGINTLTDTGPEANNVWAVQDGFQLGLPRPDGDLLGTTIQTFAPVNAFIDHIWSGDDRGATAEGFANNVALGRLVIEGQRNSRMNFAGATTNRHALYVDILQLEGELAASIANVSRQLRLSGMHIYYGNVASTTSTNLTAEALNGLALGVTGGVTNRLIWVPAFTGPGTSVDILLQPGSSETARMNIALRTSLNIDSDGDGIPNRFDEFPLFPDPDVRFTDVGFNPAAQSLALGFNAKPNERYVIEYTTNLMNPSWTVFRGNLQSVGGASTISVTDHVEAGSPQRYYRVRRVP